ncbi:hypothetical protein GSI_03284 [Ganoderma sinense ZZ0214-1]|uniref:Ricin B lectin domain-containing protein n=1 Tax=Ganoderma sinense ZZ0214-1 TaxID=1077348 RepID=A0A2G8SL68_9APHY|nr:hypothetical protein GSI_03284 [Ganoderma sinense ZZ0214-1]
MPSIMASILGPALPTFIVRVMRKLGRLAKQGAPRLNTHHPQQRKRHYTPSSDDRERQDVPARERAGGHPAAPSDKLNKFLAGNDRHSGDSQKWHLSQEDGAWMLRNVSTGHYLGVEDVAVDGHAVVRGTMRFRWDIQPDDENKSTYRLYVPNTRFNVEVSYTGNPTSGTPILLWTKWLPGKNQAWKFELADGER